MRVQKEKIINQTFVFMLITLTLIACEPSGKYPFPLNEEGPIGNFSPKQICKFHKILAEFDSRKKTPKSMVGGIVLDGVVLNITSQPKRIDRVKLKVVNVLLASNYNIESEIDVLTPARDSGNINFEIGNKYRVSIQPIAHKRFYVWGPSALQLEPPEASCRSKGSE